MKKRALHIAFVAAAVLFIAGCGSSSSSSSTTTSTTSAITSTTSAASSPTTAAAAGGAATSGPTEVDLTDFMIMPATINVKAGADVFHAINKGQSPHNFAIKATDTGKDIGTTKDLNPGQSGDATINLQPGTYIGYCSEPGHESLGMKISVVVS